jgi:hypothetical protein
MPENFPPIFFAPVPAILRFRAGPWASAAVFGKLTLLSVGSNGFNYQRTGSQPGHNPVGTVGGIVLIPGKAGWLHGVDLTGNRLAQTVTSFFNSRAGRNCRSSFDAS